MAKLNLALTLLAALFTCVGAAAQEPAEEAPPQLSAERLAVMRKAAAEYGVMIGGQESRKVALRDEPVLRWSNPVQGSQDGAVFLWTEQGLPRAIVGIYPNPDKSGGWLHEWQSLATEPLTVSRGDKAVWQPQTGGLTWTPLAKADPPADLAARRLTQMKSLARRFTASFLPWVKTDENDRIELRLLPQPLYRAQPDSQASVVDSAVFAFVQGTDPQALLLLEARRDGQSPHWQFALARLASGGLRAKLDEQPIWEQEKYNFRPDPKSPYILLKVP